MISFGPISSAPIAARDLDFVPAGAQPDDPFNLTDGLDDGLEDLGLELSWYWQTNDDQAVAPDTLQISFDPDEVLDQEAPDLSFYAQADDDPVVVDATLAYLFDASLEDDLTDPVGDYLVIEDDPIAGQPDTLFGNFDFLDDAGLFDAEESFYYQPDDDVIIVIPPGPSEMGGGGGGGKRRISFEEVDRLKRQLRDLEAKRRKKWKQKQEFEDKIEQIYRDLYETPHQAEATELVEQVIVRGRKQSRLAVSLDYQKLIVNMNSIMRLLDIYQLYLDDEEAVAILLLL